MSREAHVRNLWEPGGKTPPGHPACAVNAERRLKRIDLMRCRMRDEGWPLAVALQEVAANRPEVRRLRAVRAERRGKRRDLIASGVDQEGERKRTIDDGSKGLSR